MGCAFSAVLVTLDVVAVTVRGVGIRQACPRRASVSIDTLPSMGMDIREPIGEPIRRIQCLDRFVAGLYGGPI